MPFDHRVSPLPIRTEISEAFRREWDRLARPGTWWTGAERVAIAEAARGSLPPEALNDGVANAAQLIATRPATVTREWVEQIAGDIGFPRYVELVGVVARISAVDSFHTALGLDLEPLPRALNGEPIRREEPRAGRSPAWVPMTSGGSIVYALSLVPEEMAAQEDLHGPLYLTYEEMSDLSYVRGLSRAQMELVAARTSAVNECFY